MKANELRIGNHFQYNGYTYEVTCVENVTDGIWWIWTPEKSAINLNLCEPIPLTEEWLIKFGFKNSALNKYRFAKDTYVVAHPEAGWAFSSYHWGASKYVEYVHSLQNLYFALTGKELTKN